MIVELKRRIEGKPLLSAEIRCASHLPDWRPGRDYRDTNVEVPVPASQALALIAESENAVEDCLRRALDPATRESLWRRARTRLSDPACAADTVIRTVLADVARKPELALAPQIEQVLRWPGENEVVG